MHKKICVVVTAEDKEHAKKNAMALFTGRQQPLLRPFTKGEPFDSSTRFHTNETPAVIKQSGAIEADTDYGRKLLSEAWEQTLEKRKHNLRFIEEALQSSDSDEQKLLKNPIIERPEEEINSGFSQKRLNEAMKCFASELSVEHFLFQETGNAVMSQSEYEDLCEHINEDSHRWKDMGLNTWFAVPIDAKY
jgi:ATP-dependent DNA ligase